MSHDVFVSYPSADKSIADAVVATLETSGLRCWYAPRDVAPGADWAAAIVEAIHTCRLTILVFSEATNASPHILREVRQAADARIPILPFRVTSELPNDSLEYYIGGTHWLDALTEPLEAHLDELVATAAFIAGGSDPGPAAAAPAPRRVPVAGPGTPGRSAAGPPHHIPPRVLAIAGTVIVFIVASVVAVLTMSGGGNESAFDMPDEPGADPTAGAEAASSATASATDDEDWRALSFVATDPRLWAVDADRETAVQQTGADAFAWSTEAFDGDLSVRFDLQSPGVESSGCVIVYGGGNSFHSQGSLIFCVEWDVFSLEKHTTVHGGENILAYAPADLVFAGQVIEVEIEIAGDVASMHVDGVPVLSTVFDLDEIDRSGRIGLHKKAWIEPEVTFSNLAVLVPDDEVAVTPPGDDDAFDCSLDTGADPNHYPITSSYTTGAVVIDGAITSEPEWDEAGCVDLRMHFGITVTNPRFVQTRWWIQNDDQSIFFLVRVPAALGFGLAYADYFWPEYVGTWAHSDAISIDADGAVTDSGQWDELQFHADIDQDPAGSSDVDGALTDDGEFVWVEMRHPLDSGDGYDWVLEPGQTYGNDPSDSFLVGVEVDEGGFIRYLQLTIGEP